MGIIRYNMYFTHTLEIFYIQVAVVIKQQTQPMAAPK